MTAITTSNSIRVNAEFRAWKSPRLWRLIARIADTPEKKMRIRHERALSTKGRTNGCAQPTAQKPNKARISRTTEIRTIHGSDAVPTSPVEPDTDLPC